MILVIFNRFSEKKCRRNCNFTSHHPTMKSLIDQKVHRIAEHCIACWNACTLEQMQPYLKEDVLVRSPNIPVIYPEQVSGFIQGREMVITYWYQLIKLSGPMKLSIDSLQREGDTIHLLLKINDTEKFLATTLRYNQYGKIIEFTFDYR
jgi:hypothetical protein